MRRWRCHKHLICFLFYERDKMTTIPPPPEGPVENGPDGPTAVVNDGPQPAPSEEETAESQQEVVEEEKTDEQE